MNTLRGITEIKIGGKLRPIKFGTNSTALLCEIRGITLNDMGLMFSEERIKNNEITGGEIRDMIYAGLVSAARSKKIEIDFDQYQVGDWIDEIDPNELVKAFEVMGESQPKGSNTTAKKKVRKAS